MENLYWKAYWAEKTNGQHRSQEEAFLEAEAKEKLFHLADGERLLDFGCGSADLFVYYAQRYLFAMGVDCSELMLEKAKERLAHFNLKEKVVLGQADDENVWDVVHELLDDHVLFDRIIAGQVVQYLDKKRVEHFISGSLLHLSPGGKLCLFDVVDARTVELWQAGLFNQKQLNMSVISKIGIQRLWSLLKKLLKKPTNALGYSYPPSFFVDLAKKQGAHISIVHSLYYEYRYHVLISK